MNSHVIGRALTPAAVLSFILLSACGTAPQPHASVDVVEADQLEIVKGVFDKGRDPAVVAIDIGGQAMCSGALIAPDLVLTARHCVSRTTPQVACPPQGAQVTGNHAASALTILTGDDVETATPVAKGRALVTPTSTELCDQDIALIVLDRDVEGIEPLDVREQPVTMGEHVRAVGYGRSANEGGTVGVKLLREHVKVLQVTNDEFKVGEATCQGDSGGPALDEQTGQIVGVVSRGGPDCLGTTAHNVYTRGDAFLALIDEAVAKAGFTADGPDGGPADAGSKHKTKRDAGHHAPPPPTDMGTECKVAADCSTGVCVTDHGKQYCSRACDVHDRCPSIFKCQKTKGGVSVCIEK
jgi:hypothetical protein